MTFPTALDTFVAPSPSDALGATGDELDLVIAKIQVAVTGLETKVGVDSSAVTSTLDYKVAHPAAASLTSLAGNLSGDVTLTASSETVVLTTASLSTGTWWVSMIADVTCGVAKFLDGRMVVNTATATFSGAQSSQANIVAGGSGGGQLVLGCLATVTVAGTLDFKIYNDTATDATARKLTAFQSFANATGYTAIKIA